MTSFQRMLILETSSRTGEVALADTTRLVASRKLAESRRNASDLAIVVQELLQELSWSAKSLDAVAVSLGPGSYTALRVGLMSAKTLAFANRCPLFGIDTFDIIAAQSLESQKVLVISDALQGMVYSATYERGAKNWSICEALAIRSLPECLEKRDGETWLTGPGVDVLMSRIPSEVPRCEADQRHPQTQTMFELVQEDSERYRGDPWSLEPIYLRASSAEEKRKKHAGGTG